MKPIIGPLIHNPLFVGKCWDWGGTMWGGPELIVIKTELFHLYKWPKKSMGFPGVGCFTPISGLSHNHGSVENWAPKWKGSKLILEILPLNHDCGRKGKWCKWNYNLTLLNTWFSGPALGPGNSHTLDFFGALKGFRCTFNIITQTGGWHKFILSPLKVLFKTIQKVTSLVFQVPAGKVDIKLFSFESYIKQTICSMICL